MPTRGRRKQKQRGPHKPKRPYARLLLKSVLCCALELRVSCALASLRCARAPYIPARSHAEHSLDRSDSKEFLGCFFSFAGSPKHRLRAPGRRDCPLAVAIGGGVTVEPGASVDSQDALYGCPVCGFTPRDAATVIMSYLRIGADPLDSLDCSTVARGDALAALRRLRAAVRRRWVASCNRTYRSCQNRQQNMKAVQFS